MSSYLIIDIYNDKKIKVTKLKDSDPCFKLWEHALECIKKEDLYDLKFISLNSYSTIRTVVDDTLSKNGIDVTRLKVEMELNSIEAIKNAVQSSLGAAFVSVSAITKELELNLLNCVRIEDVKINRKLCIILNPNRYKSKASENFTKEILTLLK